MAGLVPMLLLAFVTHSAAAVRQLRGLRGVALPAPEGRGPSDYSAYTRGHRTMYLVDVTVGVAKQPFRLLVDTGSQLLVLPGAACNSSSCGKHRRLNTSGAAQQAGRSISLGFGVGSMQGRVVTEQVCFAWSSTEPLTGVSFSQVDAADARRCARLGVVALESESANFANAPYDGVLGLGPRDAKVDDAGLTTLEALGVTCFALRLGKGGVDSELVLGDVDKAALASGKALWIPLSPTAAQFWQFSVLDIAIDGRPQRLGRFEVAVDSGTSLIAADKGLKEWLWPNMEPQNCEAVNRLPKIELMLDGGVALPLLPADYVDEVAGGCSPALMPGEFHGTNSQRLVLGDSFMRRYVTIFDRAARKIGFGVAADDPLAAELLPAMFNEHSPRATVAPTMAPKAESVDLVNYSAEEFSDDLVSHEQDTHVTPAPVTTTSTTMRARNHFDRAKALMDAMVHEHGVRRARAASTTTMVPKTAQERRHVGRVNGKGAGKRRAPSTTTAGINSVSSADLYSDDMVQMSLGLEDGESQEEDSHVRTTTPDIEELYRTASRYAATEVDPNVVQAATRPLLGGLTAAEDLEVTEAMIVPGAAEASSGDLFSGRIPRQATQPTTTEIDDNLDNLQNEYVATGDRVHESSAELKLVQVRAAAKTALRLGSLGSFSVSLVRLD